MNYERIKKNYDTNLWSLEMVRKAVGIVITAEQYKMITGRDFKEELNV